MTAVSQTTKTILPVEMRPRTVIRSIALCGSTHSRLNYSQQDLFKVSKKNYVWHNGMKTCTKNEEKNWANIDSPPKIDSTPANNTKRRTFGLFATPKWMMIFFFKTNQLLPIQTFIWIAWYYANSINSIGYTERHLFVKKCDQTNTCSAERTEHNKWRWRLSTTYGFIHCGEFHWTAANRVVSKTKFRFDFFPIYFQLNQFARFFPIDETNSFSCVFLPFFS